MTSLFASREILVRTPLAYGLSVVLVALTGTATVHAEGPAEGRATTTTAEKYEALLKQYDAPRGIFIKDPSRGKTASEAFLKFARDNPNDPVSVDALSWVISHSIFTPEAEQAINLLVRDHGKSGNLVGVCKELDLLYGSTFKPVESLFRAAMEHNPSREVRAWACLGLARRLKRDKESIERERVQYAAFMNLHVPPYVMKPSATDADLAKMAAESAALFQRVIDQYGDVKGELEPIGKDAARELVDLRTLSIGITAPEIEGDDLDGKRFKLSDYRGKIVVLSFWNHQGCGLCRAMYPEERALVKRMENKPFVFLGINSGDSPEVLKKLREGGEIPWRFWVDGDTFPGKIYERWHVHGWPMIFVLDRDGTIKMKGSHLSITTIGYMADGLLSEPDTTKKP